MEDHDLSLPHHCQLALSFGKEEIQTFVLDKDIITIGRGPECDIIIDNLGASRVHAKIQRFGGFFRLFDLKSKTGTFIRGVKIKEFNLNHGDEIFLAKHTLLFKILDSQDSKNLSISKNQSTPPGNTQLLQTMAVDYKNMAQKFGPAPAYLRMMDISRPIAMYKTVIFFGKSDSCDIMLTGFLIGERHALIVREEKGFEIHHLGLFKPPRVNGEAVEYAMLESGDSIEIGQLKFVFDIPQNL